MKNILFKCALILLVSISSCSDDILEQTPLHAPDESVFWTTEQDAQKALNYLYSYLPNAKKWWSECLSDNAVMTNAWGEGNMGQISHGTVITNDWVFNSWGLY